jgi:hypothetical protein
MYTTVKGKPTYAKKDTAGARVKPRNSYARKNTGCQATWTWKLRKTERKSRRKTPNTPKRRSPQWSHQFCYEENISMARGKPQHDNNTQKSTLISNMLYK